MDAQDLITCGSDAVKAFRISGTNSEELWTWRATDSDLPDWCKPLFSTTSECKPCPGGKVLVTSSGGDSYNGAVALVDPYTSNVIFYAKAPCGHSADLLPGGRVAVAYSYHTNGNRLAVFDLNNSDREILSVPLYGAHGVVWDSRRQVLWGLADSFIREYRLKDWDKNPQLQTLSTTKLPGTSGHDMYALENNPGLLVTTDGGCYIFNRETRTFSPHPSLATVRGIKSVSAYPKSGATVYVKADVSWWTEKLRFVGPEKTISFASKRFYKARWIPPGPSEITLVPASNSTLIIAWEIPWYEHHLEHLMGTNWVQVSEPIQTTMFQNFVIQHLTEQIGFFRLRRIVNE